MIKINIVYLKNIDEVLNRKSALGSYIFCLAGLLNDKCSVYINNVPFKDLTQYETNKISIAPKKRWFVKLIPSFLKQHLKLQRLFQTNESNLHKLINQNVSACDFVLEYYTLGSDAGMQMAKKSGAKLILVYDAPVEEEYRFFNGSIPNKYLKKIRANENNSLKNAYKVVCYSNAVKQFLMLKFKLDEKMVFIHQNVDFSRFTFYNSNKNYEVINICFIGSFLKWHHVDFLIKAVKHVVKHTTQIKVFLIGEGQLLHECRKLVQELKLQDYVVFTGYLDGNELESYKQIMNLGVMPGSNWYGAPNKIFEYGAAGMAVLAPNTPTIVDIFEQTNGIKYFNNEDYADFEIKFEEAVLELKSGLSNSAVRLNDFVRSNYNAEKTTSFYTLLFK